MSDKTITIPAGTPAPVIPPDNLTTKAGIEDRLDSLYGIFEKRLFSSPNQAQVYFEEIEELEFALRFL